MKVSKIKSILTSKLCIAVVAGVIGFSIGTASTVKSPEVAKDKEIEEVNTEVPKDEAEEVEFGAGTYTAGEDFKEGKYDIIAISGGGNVMSTSQINAIMGKDKDNDMYVEEYKNATFKWASQVKITNNLKVKFIPVKE